MFWGLIMEPHKRYSQTVKKSFHISMATIDLNSCTEEPVQVLCGFDNRKYLMCTLKKDGILQCQLDLNFDIGDEVSFAVNGESFVHLTGYLNDDVMDDLDDLDEEEVEEEEDEAAQLGNISESNIVSGKRPKKAVTADFQPPAKKSKTMKLLEEYDQDDSDESDEEVDALDLINTSNEDDSMFLEDDDDDDEEEAEDEEDGNEGEEEESDDEDLSSMGEEEESEDDDEEDEVEVKPKMNGTAQKKPKQQQQAQKANKKKEVVKETPKKEANKEKPKAEKTPKGEKNGKLNNAGSPQKKQVEGGVTVEDLKAGGGQQAKPGKMVQVYYEGRLKSNNKVFDSSNKGSGFKFRLGKQEVIKGWDVGVAGMKVGGKRRITCPPNMAYGQRGAPPTIPPNATLVFDVELKNVN